MYRESYTADKGHICTGGGAAIHDSPIDSVVNSPINITINVTIKQDSDGKIKGVFANAFKGRFRKPVQAQGLLDQLFSGGDSGEPQVRRLHQELRARPERLEITPL